MTTRFTTFPAVLIVLVGTAEADTWKADVPVTYEAGTPTATPATAPEVTIVSPESLEIVPTHAQVLGEGGDRLNVQCMLTAGQTIKLQVKNWKLSPGGNGVTLVIDNKVGKTIHDLSKPIPLTDLIPIPKTSEDAREAIAASCGWHFLAVFATLPNGESVKTPGALAVAPFILGKRSEMDVPGLIKGKVPLLIVNVPLLGTPMKRADGPGFKPADPDKVMVDFLIWNGPDSGLRGTNWVTSVGNGVDPSTDFKEKVGPVYVRHLTEGANNLTVFLQTYEADWQWFDSLKYVLYNTK